MQFGEVARYGKLSFSSLGADPNILMTCFHFLDEKAAHIS
jgi:hypothetical protein